MGMAVEEPKPRRRSDASLNPLSEAFEGSLTSDDLERVAGQTYVSADHFGRRQNPFVRRRTLCIALVQSRYYRD